nr:basic proline-rich protein-like [Camelus dromedarius]
MEVQGVNQDMGQRCLKHQIDVLIRSRPAQRPRHPRLDIPPESPVVIGRHPPWPGPLRPRPSLPGRPPCSPPPCRRFVPRGWRARGPRVRAWAGAPPARPAGASPSFRPDLPQPRAEPPGENTRGPADLARPPPPKAPWDCAQSALFRVKRRRPAAHFVFGVRPAPRPVAPPFYHGIKILFHSTRGSCRLPRFHTLRSHKTPLEAPSPLGLMFETTVSRFACAWDLSVIRALPSQQHKNQSSDSNRQPRPQPRPPRPPGAALNLIAAKHSTAFPPVPPTDVPP